MTGTTSRTSLSEMTKCLLFLRLHDICKEKQYKHNCSLYVSSPPSSMKARNCCGYVTFPTHCLQDQRQSTLLEAEKKDLPLIGKPSIQHFCPTKAANALQKHLLYEMKNLFKYQVFRMKSCKRKTFPSLESLLHNILALQKPPLLCRNICSKR